MMIYVLLGWRWLVVEEVGGVGGEGIVLSWS